MPDLSIRPAGRGDAAAITVLADIAGYGLPCWIWSNAPDRGANESVMAYGRRWVLSEEGKFSWRNAHVAAMDGDVSGLLLGYRQPDEPQPIDETLPRWLQPLLELEGLAPGSWYVNILAVFEEYRGRGIGAALLAKAEELAAQASADRLSIIVEDDNHRAIMLYERTGYERVASRPYVSYPGGAPAQEWILMAKNISR